MSELDEIIMPEDFFARYVTTRRKMRKLCDRVLRQEMAYWNYPWRGRHDAANVLSCPHESYLATLSVNH